MTVESTNNPSNLAYTSGRLTLHVDLSTVNYSPEVSKKKHSPSLYDKLHFSPCSFKCFTAFARCPAPMPDQDGIAMDLPRPITWKENFPSRFAS